MARKLGLSKGLEGEASMYMKRGWTRAKAATGGVARRPGHGRRCKEGLCVCHYVGRRNSHQLESTGSPLFAAPTSPAVGLVCCGDRPPKLAGDHSVPPAAAHSTPGVIGCSRAGM